MTATKKNVLLVDDDKIFNFLNRHVLTATGLANQINTALNGSEALSYFDNSGPQPLAETPEVVLLDLNMPVMDGFEFMKAFQILNFPGKEKVVIIVVTSSMNPDDIRRAKELGVKHYLNKPLTEEDLTSVMTE
jgi:CheY-like chemotaxis protein